MKKTVATLVLAGGLGLVAYAAQPFVGSLTALAVWLAAAFGLLVWNRDRGAENWPPDSSSPAQPDPAVNVSSPDDATDGTAADPAFPAPEADFSMSAAIAVIRKPRAGLDMTSGTSWLGGLPALGDHPWPRSDGRPMHHLARIDLAKLHAFDPPADLPSQGSLAFFIGYENGRPTGRVLHVTDPAPAPSRPPEDMPITYSGDEWAYYNPGHTAATAPRHFPRWPVEFAALPFDDGSTLWQTGEPGPAHTEMRTLFPETKDVQFSAYHHRETRPELFRPQVWESAQRFAGFLQNALDRVENTRRHHHDMVAINERNLAMIAEGTYKGPGDLTRHQALNAEYRANLDFVLSHETDFAILVAKVSKWAHGHDRWAPMADKDIETLAKISQQAQQNYGRPGPGLWLYCQHVPGRLFDSYGAARLSLRSMAQDAGPGYDAMPAPLRDELDRFHRLPGIARWHQMFGHGSEVQDAVGSHEAYHLLLQLHSDDLMNWMWGDVGVLQFWISPADLAARRWDKVEMTFDAH